MRKEFNISENGKKSLISSLRKHMLIVLDPQITNMKINNEANNEVDALFLTCMNFGLHKRIETQISEEENERIQASFLESYCLFNSEWSTSFLEHQIKSKVPLYLSIVDNGKDIPSAENMKIIVDIFKNINKKYKINADLEDLVDPRYEHLLDEV